MFGYVLYRDARGVLERIEADRTGRRRIVRELEDAVPPGGEVVGIVLDAAPDDGPRLTLVD